MSSWAILVKGLCMLMTGRVRVAYLRMNRLHIRSTQLCILSHEPYSYRVKAFACYVPEMPVRRGYQGVIDIPW